MNEDDDRPKKKITHEIGQDLALLSVKELQERIALLQRGDRAAGSLDRQQADVAQRRRSVLQEMSLQLRTACRRHSRES